MGSEVLLEMQGITKEFPGVKALDDVSFTLRRGTVHSLVGENGAGKSTLMKCLFGLYRKDRGKILLEGREVNFVNSKDALEHGVAMVHQELNQALKQSVLDNLWLGRYPTKFGVYIDKPKMLADTKKIFERLKLDVDPHRKMETMPVSQRQMVEIAKAVSYDAKVFVFDEPTSSLTDREIEKLFAIIGQLRERGCGIVYISHKMDEILKISDEVTIMRDGRHIVTRDAKSITIPEIIKFEVGREIDNVYPPKTNKPGEVSLEVEGLSGIYNILRDVSFNARKGEVLGIAGLDGSGRTEILESLFGLRKKTFKAIRLNGKPISNKSAGQAIKNGFGLVTEERRATGIMGILDIQANSVIANLDKYRRFRLVLSDKQMKSDTDWAISALRTKTPSQKTKIRALSGGNQQKVVFGRWMLRNPEVFLLDEPTRGIDVGAKYEIYQIILDMANQGKVVIVVSSEMPELLGICDRILVMSGGRLAGEVNPKTTSQEEIMTLAAQYV
jgi:methyl-galactoside transport system ATP-binding protein